MVLTQDQIDRAKKLYFADIPLDDIADDYRRVICNLLDTIQYRDEIIANLRAEAYSDNAGDY